MKIFNLTLAALLAASIFGVCAQDTKEINKQDFHTSKQEALDASGLTPYATIENDEIITKSSKFLEEIKASTGSSFGGSWIEYDEKNKAVQVIAITESNSLKFINLKKPDYPLKFVNVKYSYAELDKIATRILAVFGNINGSADEQLIFATAVDEQINSVVVHAREEYFGIVKERLASAGFNMEAIKLIAQDGPVELYGTLYGGSKILTGNSTSSPLASCTAGFNVVIDVIYPGTITAAHCYIRNSNAKYAFFNLGSTNQQSVGPLIGEFFAIGWPDKMDAAIFGNTNFVHTVPPKILTGPSTSQSVKPLGGYAINSSVCTYGGTNGWRCGLVKVLNTNVNMGGGTYMNMVQADFCGGPGDSGGPVVNNSGNALGLMTGGLGGGSAGTCGPIFGGGTRPNAIFQPLAPYLAKYSNVQIATE